MMRKYDMPIINRQDLPDKELREHLKHCFREDELYGDKCDMSFREVPLDTRQDIIDEFIAWIDSKGWDICEYSQETGANYLEYVPITQSYSELIQEYMDTLRKPKA